MIKYFKLHGKINKSTIDNKLYRYDYETRDWKYSAYCSRQYLLYWYDNTQLTLLDIVMLGIPE